MIGFLTFMVICLTCVAVVTLLALGSCVTKIRTLSSLAIENRTDNMLNRAHIEMLRDTKVERAEISQVLRDASN